MTFEYREIRAGGLTMRAGLLDSDGQDDSENAAPPLLMLNGIGFNAELMEPLAKKLAKPGPDAPHGRSVVIPDMPGCGGSPDSAGNPMMYRLSTAVTALMDALHPKQNFDCVGFSWGGALAQQIAVQASRRVSRLALVSTTSGLPVAPANPEVISRLFDAREYIDPSRLAENFHALLVEGGASAGLMTKFRVPSPHGVSNQLLALTGWTVAPMLPFVRVPVALVGVADDAVVPYAHHSMLSCLIPHAHKIEIPSGGHLSALAQPERVAPALRDFLAA